MTFSAPEHRAMQRALTIAGAGRGRVSPNPLVGAVLLRDDRIIGEAYHARCGDLHAEARLLSELPEAAARGATLVLNLEPCCHHGRTPPCAELVAEHGLKRVVIAMRDPNPLVAGGGVEYLRRAGIEVASGLMTEAAMELNRGFLARHLRGRPWLTLKLARTLDGCITPAGATTGRITGEAAQRNVHRLRSGHDAILVGINTVLCDDPQLNVRHGDGPHPLKLVLDSRLRLPLDARIVKQAERESLIVLTDENVIQSDQAVSLRDRGVEVAAVPRSDDGLDLRRVVELLRERGVNSLLVEGGGEVFNSFVSHDLYDGIVFYTGGWLAAAGRQVPAPAAGRELELSGVIQLDNDLRADYLAPVTREWWRRFAIEQAEQREA